MADAHAAHVGDGVERPGREHAGREAEVTRARACGRALRRQRRDSARRRTATTTANVRLAIMDDTPAADSTRAPPAGPSRTGVVPSRSSHASDPHAARSKRRPRRSTRRWSARRWCACTCPCRPPTAPPSRSTSSSNACSRSARSSCAAPMNAVRQLSPAELADGVWTVSAGNAAQGVAFAARAVGVPCSVHGHGHGARDQGARHRAPRRHDRARDLRRMLADRRNASLGPDARPLRASVRRRRVHRRQRHGRPRDSRGSARRATWSSPPSAVAACCRASAR